MSIVVVGGTRYQVLGVLIDISFCVKGVLRQIRRDVRSHYMVGQGGSEDRELWIVFGLSSSLPFVIWCFRRMLLFCGLLFSDWLFLQLPYYENTQRINTHENTQRINSHDNSQRINTYENTQRIRQTRDILAARSSERNSE